MTITTKKFNGLLKTIKGNDAKQAEMIQQAIEFCFEQASEHANLSPIDKLLFVIGSSRTLRYKQVEGYILAHLKGISIKKGKPTTKVKTKDISLVIPSMPWYEWARREIEQAEGMAIKKINLETRLESILKAVANGDQIEVKDKEHAKLLAEKVLQLIA